MFEKGRREFRVEAVDCIEGSFDAEDIITERVDISENAYESIAQL